MPKKVPLPEPDTHQGVYRLTQHPGNKDSEKISSGALKQSGKCFNVMAILDIQLIQATNKCKLTWP